MSHWHGRARDPWACRHIGLLYVWLSITAFSDDFSPLDAVLRLGLAIFSSKANLAS